MRDNGQRAKRFRPGMRSIPARDLNTLTDLANKQRDSVAAARQKSGTAARLRRFELVSIQNDYLTCYLPDTTITVYVAKPYLLRYTPFHGLTRDGVTYSYSDAQTRTATSGGESETQYVIPEYIAGDEILASWIGNGTGISTAGSAPIYWLAQDDTRAWASELLLIDPMSRMPVTAL